MDSTPAISHEIIAASSGALITSLFGIRFAHLLVFWTRNVNVSIVWFDLDDQSAKHM